MALTEEKLGKVLRWLGQAEEAAEVLECSLSTAQKQLGKQVSFKRKVFDEYARSVEEAAKRLDAQAEEEAEEGKEKLRQKAAQLRQR